MINWTGYMITINKRIVLNLSAIKRKHRYVCFTETYLGCLELFFCMNEVSAKQEFKEFSLNMLSLKTVFLFTLVSLKRVSDIHRIVTDPDYFQQDQF